MAKNSKSCTSSDLSEEDDFDQIGGALDALESSQDARTRKLTSLFTSLFEKIHAKLEAGVSRTAVIATLNKHGQAVNFSEFEKFYAAEAEARGIKPVRSKKAKASDKQSDEVAH